MLNRKVSQLLKNIDKNLTQLEKIGMQCARRNGSAQELAQKKSIDLATKITLKCIYHQHYEQAFNIAKCVCNMTMGPFKSACAKATAKAFIDKNQYSYATKLACLLAPLKGTLKIKTARSIAKMLREHKQNFSVLQIYQLLQKNPSDSANLAAMSILKKVPDKKVGVSEMLATIHENIMSLERIGIKFAKRNGCVDEPEQKVAIDNAKKIALELIEQAYYESAFNIVKHMCNITLGPFKAACAFASAEAFIKANQIHYAKKIGQLLAPLAGKLKAKTACDIAVKLIENNHISAAQSIQRLLIKNTTKSAQGAVFKLKTYLDTKNEKTTTFLDTFKLANEGLIDIYRQEATNKRSTNLIKLMQRFKKILNTDLKASQIQCLTADSILPKMEFNFSQENCKLYIHKIYQSDIYTWEFTSNSILKNNTKITEQEYKEFSTKLDEFIVLIKQKKVEFYGCKQTV